MSLAATLGMTYRTAADLSQASIDELMDPREIKAALQGAWKHFDNRTSFEAALKERGFWLAKGDRRGFVALDYRGEVYSLSRYAGVKTKEMEARLGESERLPSASEIKATIAQGMTHKVNEFIKEANSLTRQRLAMLDFRKGKMVARHQDERATITAQHQKRWQAETMERSGKKTSLTHGKPSYATRSRSMNWCFPISKIGAL